MATAPTRRRADAERSIEAIVAAATDCFGRSADASMAEIAKAAGVGRVTLYAHFSSREALLEVLLERGIDAAEAAFAGEDLESGPPAEAFARLIRSSWRILDRYGTVRAAAMRWLPPESMRAKHERPLTRVRRLIERGRRTGDFRTDLPTEWLVTSFYTLLHAAGQEVELGRLKPARAAAVLEATLMGMLRP